MVGMKHAILVAGLAGSVLVSAVEAAPVIVDLSNASGGNSALTALLADGSATVTYNQYRSYGTLSENLTDINGVVTPFDVRSVVTGSLGTNGGSVSGDVAAIFPSIVAQDLTWTDNVSGLLTLSGLDNSKTYDFEVYSARTTSGGTAITGFTAAGTNSVTGSVNSRGNTSNLVLLSGVQPTTSGTINISWYKGAGTTVNFAYFNAFRFTEVVPEPASMGLLGGAVLLLGRRARKA